MPLGPFGGQRKSTKTWHILERRGAAVGGTFSPYCIDSSPTPVTPHGAQATDVFAYAEQDEIAQSTARTRRHCGARIGRTPMDNHGAYSGSAEGLFVRDITAFHDGLEILCAARGFIQEAANSEGGNVSHAKMSLLLCCYASDDATRISSYRDNARFQRRLSEALHQRRQQTKAATCLRKHRRSRICHSRQCARTCRSAA